MVSKIKRCSNCERSFRGSLGRTLCRVCRISHEGSRDSGVKLEQREIPMYGESQFEKGIRKSEAWKKAVEATKLKRATEAEAGGMIDDED